MANNTYQAMLQHGETSSALKCWGLPSASFACHRHPCTVARSAHWRMCVRLCRIYRSAATRILLFIWLCSCTSTAAARPWTAPYMASSMLDRQR